MQSNITTEPIRTTNELEFAFFCIESIAEKVHKDPVVIYNALTKDSNLLNTYIASEKNVAYSAMWRKVDCKSNFRFARFTSGSPKVSQD